MFFLSKYCKNTQEKTHFYSNPKTNSSVLTQRWRNWIKGLRVTLFTIIGMHKIMPTTNSTANVMLPFGLYNCRDADSPLPSPLSSVFQWWWLRHVQILFIRILLSRGEMSERPGIYTYIYINYFVHSIIRPNHKNHHVTTLFLYHTRSVCTYGCEMFCPPLLNSNSQPPVVISPYVSSKYSSLFHKSPIDRCCFP